MRTTRTITPGEVFGRLTTLSRAGVGKRMFWFCQCSCGASTKTTLSRLISGCTKSCGCLRAEGARTLAASRKLPGRGTVEYKAWVQLKGRCLNPNYQDFQNYGGRGIRVDPDWLNSFERFLADMGPRPDGMSLDTENVNGDYTAANCRWATPITQSNNRRCTRYVEHGGKRLSVSQWARELGLGKATLLARLYAGWPPERALLTPVAPRARAERKQ